MCARGHAAIAVAISAVAVYAHVDMLPLLNAEGREVAKAEEKHGELVAC